MLKLENALHPPTDHNFYYRYCVCRAVNFIQHYKLPSAKVISSITEVHVLNLVRHNIRLQILEGLELNAAEPNVINLTKNTDILSSKSFIHIWDCFSFQLYAFRLATVFQNGTVTVKSKDTVD